MYLAYPKGLHRFLETDWEHEGVAHTAVTSAGNSTLVPGSQAAPVQVGRNLRGTFYKSSSQNMPLIQERGWVDPQQPV